MSVNCPVGELSRFRMLHSVKYTLSVLSFHICNFQNQSLSLIWCTVWKFVMKLHRLMQHMEKLCRMAPQGFYAPMKGISCADPEKFVRGLGGL